MKKFLLALALTLASLVAHAEEVHKIGSIGFGQGSITNYVNWPDSDKVDYNFGIDTASWESPSLIRVQVCLEMDRAGAGPWTLTQQPGGNLRLVNVSVHQGDLCWYFAVAGYGEDLLQFDRDRFTLTQVIRSDRAIFFVYVPKE